MRQEKLSVSRGRGSRGPMPANWIPALARMIGLFGVSLCLTSCASLDTSMTASSDVNADINGNPSAIAISIFELSAPAEFNQANFIDLYTEAQKVLGPTLLAEQDLMLTPGETTKISLSVQKNVHDLGYLAAYRNLNTVTWRVLIPIAPNFLLGQKFKLSVTANGMVLQQ